MTDHSYWGRRIVGWLLAGTVLAGVGCVRRTIEITSTPPDALVWVNTREVGRTPVTFEFTFDGVYDVRLRRDGFAPLVTSASTDPPLWDLPGFDFLAEIMPLEFERSVHWHFDLEPIVIDPAARIQRAGKLRSELDAWDSAPLSVSRDEAGSGNAEELAGPPSPFGRPSLPPDTAPGEAPVRPPELYPSGSGIQPDE